MLETEGVGIRQVEQRVAGGDVGAGSGDLVASEEEPEGDQQAARCHERDHVGDTGHQHPTDPATPRLLGRPTALARGGRSLHPRCVRVVGVAKRLGDHRVAVVDRALHTRRHDGLAGEPAPVAHPHVDREDHRVGRGDDVGGEGGRARRALGLDLDVDAGALGSRLECLGRHVGVGDAGRAGGDADEAAPAAGVGRGSRRGGLRGGSGCGVLGRGSRGIGQAELAAYELHDVVGGLGGAQRVGEGRLHQRPRELGEDREVVGVAAGRGGDEEGEVGRAVLGAEVDPGGEPGEGEGRLLDARRAAVGDRDAAGEAGGRGLLAGEGVGDQLVDVGRAARVADDGGERTDDVLLGLAERGVEPDEVGGDEVGHGGAPQDRSRSVTATRVGSTCCGVGMVVPGRPAAALP